MTEQALAGSTVDHAERPGADDGSPVRPMRADARRNYDKLVAAARQVFLEQGGGASLEALRHHLTARPRPGRLRRLSP